MTFAQWKALWRIERSIDIPHLAVALMCPWLFVRVLWYFCPREFKAWPSQYETGVVIGWRWPFAKTFREKSWVAKEDMPLVLYGAMDEAYVARATKELGWGDEAASDPRAFRKFSPYLAATIRELKNFPRTCGHNYWIADCPSCARSTLTLAAMLMSKYKPASVPNPNEDPVVAFRRRQAEAARLESERQKCLEK